MQTRARAEYDRAFLQVVPGDGVFVPHRDRPLVRRARLAEGQRDARIILPVALRHRDFAAVVDADRQIDVVRPSRIHALGRRNRDRPERKRLVKPVNETKDAVLVGLLVRRLPHELFRRVALWRRERQDADFAVVLVAVVHLHVRGIGKPGRHPSAAFDIDARIDELSHGVRRRDPRAAAHRPSRAVLHLEGEPPLRAALGGMAYHVVPFRAEALDLLLYAGPLAVADLPVEELDARDAHIAQSVEIGVEPGFRHVPADQVEPRLGTMLLGRILER